MAHRNWFLTLVEKHIIPIVWIALLLSVILTMATYFIEPIYSAKSELILDASLEKLLPNIDNGLPSTNATDYIRQEYFAINSVNMMQKPAIGKQIILEDGLTDKNGNPINVNNFINPSLFDLIFSNNGQGITIKWISDTQQFSITGYGKDVESAAILASRYTDVFMSYDKYQFKNILENLRNRQTAILNTARNKRLAVEKEQVILRKEYGVGDWGGRLESLTASIASIEQDINTEDIAESTRVQRLKELEKQLTELKIPIHMSETEGKNTTLTSLQNSLTNLSQQLAAASVDYTPNHPEFKKIQKQIEFVRQQMTDESNREYTQSTQNTSEALDNILTSIMQARENRAVRTAKYTELNTMKERYLSELNFVAKGQALYNNLEGTKSGLNEIIKNTSRDLIQIEALIHQPFSFFRIITQPFVDTDNIANHKYSPQRKLTLLLSFIGIFLMMIFYIVIRELHLETLFYAWQLRHLPDGVKSIDIISDTNNRKISSPARHIFYSSIDTGKIFRIRPLEHKSNPNYVAKLGTKYFFTRGESTLIVNNRLEHRDLECPQGTGLRSWLTGHAEEATDGIQKTSKGYDILCDSHWNPDEPWVRTKNDIKNLFSTLSAQYNNILLIDPSPNSDKRSIGDALTPDIDILTINSGSLSVSQTLEMVQHERQTFKGGKIILLVINDRESVNLFSIRGTFLLFFRFFKAPFELIAKK